MKSTVKLLALLLAASGVTSAASVVAHNMVDWDFRTPDDVALDTTYTAKIGFLSNVSILNATSTFETINAAWVNAGNITVAAGDAAGYNGYFNGRVTFTDAAGLAGKDIYVWVTNGSGLNAVLKSLTADFPANGDVPNQSNVAIYSGDFATQWSLLLGTINTESGNIYGDSIVLNEIPEPSVLLLGGIGLLGLVRRRRN